MAPRPAETWATEEGRAPHPIGGKSGHWHPRIGASPCYPRQAGSQSRGRASSLQESEAQPLETLSGASADPSQGLGRPASGRQAVWKKSAILWVHVRLVGLTQRLTLPGVLTSGVGRTDPLYRHGRRGSSWRKTGPGLCSEVPGPQESSDPGPRRHPPPPGRWWGRVSGPTEGHPWEAGCLTSS